MAPANADRGSERVQSLWWLGCHGGAGTSTVAHLVGIGVEAPKPQTLTFDDGVVLTCRASATGLEAAARLVNEWSMMRYPARLLGLVVVAGAPGRRPRIIRERIEQIGQHVPHVWWVGWIDALLVSTHPDQVGASPHIQDITTALESLVMSSSDYARSHAA